MVRDTRAFIAACPVCACGKFLHQTPAGLLNLLQRPWSHVMVDFVTGLPPSDGHMVTLTVVDRFSKVEYFVSKLPSAAETRYLLVQDVFRLHGILKDIISDWGLSSPPGCGRPSASVSLSSGYRPQSNSQIESMNQRLESALRCITACHPTAWSSYLLWVEYSHNSLVS